jgi:MoaA/NifB/PqqE/SkfB family radical SAM enzyme
MCERELLPKNSIGKTQKGVIEFDTSSPLDLSKNMNADTWKLIADRFMPHAENMELGGLGEPTLSPIFVPAAKEIVSTGKNLFFFTNGHYLGKKSILDSVGDVPRVSVSIDAGTDEAYRRVRKGDLAELVTNVQIFRKAKPGAIMLSQFTATAANIDELPKWVELCARLGIGRHSDGAEITMVGADHHVTSRVNQSIRFFRDRTLRMVDEARTIAEKEGIWFIAQLPTFSDLNPNAGEDGTDLKGWRRYTDFLMSANPCGGIGTATTTAIINSGSGSPGLTTGSTGAVVILPEVPWFKLPTDSPLKKAAVQPLSSIQPDNDENVEYFVAPREVYVDHTGEVWSCLARHSIGNIREGDWMSIIEKNKDYQAFLSNWANETSMDNKVCRLCPRKK